MNIINRHNDKGHCIHCNILIELNPQKPYCAECYDSWANNKDDRHEETYCHVCGDEKQTKKLKPACYDCYELKKDDLQFIA